MPPKSPIILFLDESGYTGTDLLNKQQPIQVIGGWMFHEPHVQRAEEFYRGQSLALNPNALEVKSSQWLANAKSKRLAKQTCDSLISMGGCPLAWVHEKRFFLSGKLVDYFLDHQVNSSVSDEQFMDSDIRRRWAQEICVLDEQVILDLWNAILEINTAHCEIWLARLVSCLESIDSPTVHYWKHMIGRCNRVFRDAGLALFGPKKDSPSMTGLAGIMSDLDIIAKKFHTTIQVYHDETATIQDSLTGMFNMIRTGPSKEIRFRDGSTVSADWSSLQLQFVDSQTTQLVQASDLLVSIIRQVYQRGSGLGTEFDDLAKLATDYLKPTATGPRLIISDQLATRAEARLGLLPQV